MNLPEQIAWLSAQAYWHQDEPVIEEVRQSLKLLRTLLDELPVTDIEQLKEAYALYQKRGSGAEAALKQPSGEVMKYKKYQSFVDLYFTFCKSYIGVEPRMDARQGKAMNLIIEYLVSNSKKKTEDGALAAWEFILKNWLSLTPYIRNQTTCAQVLKNIQEILTQLRNGNTKQDRAAKATSSIRERFAGGGKG